jgi:hypothetical protein
MRDYRERMGIVPAPTTTWSRDKAFDSLAQNIGLDPLELDQPTTGQDNMQTVEDEYETYISGGLETERSILRYWEVRIRV